MKTKFLITCVIIILAYAVTGNDDFEKENKTGDEYCKNVQLYIDSNGMSGWPDYNSTFDEYCKIKNDIKNQTRT